MATGCRTSSGFVTPRSLQIDPTSAHLMSTISKVDNLIIYPFCIYNNISYIHGWSSSTHLRISTSNAVFSFCLSTHVKCTPFIISLWSASYPSRVPRGPILHATQQQDDTIHRTWISISGSGRSGDSN